MLNAPPPAGSAWRRSPATRVLDVWFPHPASAPSRLDAPDAGRRASTGTSARRARGHGRDDRSPTSPRRRRTPPTPTCACTCCRTASSGRARSTSTASSGCSPTSRGRRPAPCAARRIFDATRARALRRAASTSTVSASTSSPGWSTTSCPSGVRIADADRVRLGAHLAEGTTVMHEGFVQLQRRHAGRLHGRGPHLRRGRRRRRLRHRRRRLDHGHAVRRRHRGHLASASAA